MTDNTGVSRGGDDNVSSVHVGERGKTLVVLFLKRKRELAELLFIDIKEGFIQKVDLGYTLVSPIIELRLHISLSYN